MQVLFVSHKGLASGMKTGLEFIIGNNNDLKTVELNEKGIEDFRNKVREAESAFDKSKELVLLADIPSGSPGTTAYEITLKSGFKVKYIAGVNLPFLVQFALSKDIDNSLLEGKENLKAMNSVNSANNDEEF